GGGPEAHPATSTSSNAASVALPGLGVAVPDAGAGAKRAPAWIFVSVGVITCAIQCAACGGRSTAIVGSRPVRCNGRDGVGPRDTTAAGRGERGNHGYRLFPQADDGEE